MKRPKITSVDPADHLSIAQRPADEANAIRDRLREAEGKASGKLARTNPNYGYEPGPRGA